LRSAARSVVPLTASAVPQSQWRLVNRPNNSLAWSTEAMLPGTTC